MRTSNGSRPAGNAQAVIFDSGGILVQERERSYFWRLKGTRAEYGPFDTLIDALDDVERRGSADLIGNREDWLDDVGYEAAFQGRPADAA
jgi:hypothetical protein